MFPLRLIKTTTFRLVLLYMLLFGMSVLVLFGFLYWTTAGFLQRQTDATVLAEIQGLSEQYGQQGLAGLVRVITARIASDPSGASLYLLTDYKFTPLAGNLKRWPTMEEGGDGWLTMTYSTDQEKVKRYARLRRFLLKGEFHLLVGRDVTEKAAIEDRLKDSLGWGLGLILICGFAGGLAMSRGMLRRLDVITRASDEIMQGDLSRRIPVQAHGDEFDRLSMRLNEMLDRIQALLEGLKQVSSNIAHDLRTPLARLRGRLEMALREGPDADASRGILEQTIEETDELLRTFNALLKIAQVEAGANRDDMQEVELSSMAADLAELYEPLAEEKGLRLELRLLPGVRVPGNPHLLSQAIVNLLENAIKYTPAPGVVELGLDRDQGVTTLWVADTGPGVPEEARDKVLDRFYRLEASRSTPGSGLGLSLVNAVAKLHKAELRLEDNAPGLRVSLSFEG